MRNLQDTLEYCFSHVNGSNFNRLKVPPRIDRGTLFMSIPTTEDSFEVPMLAMSAFVHSTTTWQAESIVAPLNCLGAESSYKSLDASIREVLRISFSANHLISLPSSPSEPYFGVQGTIFNKDFLPVAMLSWQMQRVPPESDEDIPRIKFVKPILRVSPEVFLRRSNAVERYIINKIIPSVLSLRYVWTPNIGNNRVFENSYTYYNKPSVIIESSPFLFKRPEVPSISTTNEQLLQVALAHMDELTHECM